MCQGSGRLVNSEGVNFRQAHARTTSIQAQIKNWARFAKAGAKLEVTLPKNLQTRVLGRGYRGNGGVIAETGDLKGARMILVKGTGPDEVVPLTMFPE